jgi:hypothetical protein
MILYDKRIKIARQFEIWCEKNEVRLCAQSVMSFLDMIGVLDEEKVDTYLKTVKYDNRSYTGIKKFEKSKDEPKERKGKKK